MKLNSGNLNSWITFGLKISMALISVLLLIAIFRESDSNEVLPTPSPKKPRTIVSKTESLAPKSTETIMSRQTEIQPKDAPHADGVEDVFMIQKFNDPKLIEKYAYQFSLIGEAKTLNSFGKSGFDTEANARLAADVIRQFDYDHATRENFIESQMALAHLAHSEMELSVDLIEELSEKLLADLKAEHDAAKADLISLDLDQLISALSVKRPNQVSKLYSELDFTRGRSRIALSFQAALESHGLRKEEAIARMHRYGIQPALGLSPHNDLLDRIKRRKQK